MKKTKFLALTLVVAIMLMGAGYAFWTEELKINTTVTTGMLDFEFQNERVVEVSRGMDYDNHSSMTADNPWNDDSKLDINLYNMYPGATATVSFEVKNAGTLDGKLKSFSLDDFDLSEYIMVKSLKYDGIERVTDIEIEDLDDELNKLDIQIPRDGSKAFALEFYIKKCATEEQFNENLGRFGHNNAIKFTLTAKGLQYNDDGSCPPQEPEEPEEPEDPVIEGLRFEGNVQERGSKPTKYYVVGKVYFVYSDKTEKLAGNVDAQIDRYNGRVTKTFDGFTITFKTSNKGVLTWE